MIKNACTERVYLMLALSILGLDIPVKAANDQNAVPASRIFGHFVGRAIVPSSGDIEAIGYYAFLDRIPGPFFAGAPSEATAFFTFRTSPLVFSDVFINGSIAWATEQAGSTFSVYFNASPHGDWNNPDSFSTGQLIATLRRSQGFFMCNGDLSLLNMCSDFVSTKLASSSDFTFNGETMNFGRLIPFGINNVTPAIDTSFPGFAAAFVGYHMALGRSQDQN